MANEEKMEKKTENQTEHSDAHEHQGQGHYHADGTYHEGSHEHSHDEHAGTAKNATEKKADATEKTGEKKADEKATKKEESKKAVKPVVKKEEAVARGDSVRISRKQGEYICTFIKGKKIDEAIEDLRKVMKLKKAVPFKGEIPHRKGKGMMSGRYPVKASGYFISMLKGLRGNVIVNGMDLEKTKIYFAHASIAARPMKSGGRRAKRTNIVIKAKEFATRNK